MFCMKCGNQVEEGAVFCNKCGNRIVPVAASPASDRSAVSDTSIPAAVGDNTSRDTTLTKIVIPIIVGTALAIIILILGMNGYLAGGNRYISMVKGGHPDGYPEKTYESAFNDFFAKPKWKYFKAESGADIVQFDGECTYNEKPAHLAMQFDVNASARTFYVYAVELDGEPQNKLVIAMLLAKIFEG